MQPNQTTNTTTTATTTTVATSSMLLTHIVLTLLTLLTTILITLPQPASAQAGIYNGPTPPMAENKHGCYLRRQYAPTIKLTNQMLTQNLADPKLTGLYSPTDHFRPGDWFSNSFDRICVQFSTAGYGYTNLGTEQMAVSAFDFTDTTTETEFKRDLGTTPTIPAYCTIAGLKSSRHTTSSSNQERMTIAAVDDLNKNLRETLTRNPASVRGELMLSPEEFAYLQSMYPPSPLTLVERSEANMTALIAHASFEMGAETPFVQNTGGITNDAAIKPADQRVQAILTALRADNTRVVQYGNPPTTNPQPTGYGQSLYTKAKQLVQNVRERMPKAWTDTDTLKDKLTVTDTEYKDNPGKGLEKLDKIRTKHSYNLLASDTAQTYGEYNDPRPSNIKPGHPDYNKYYLDPKLDTGVKQYGNPLSQRKTGATIWINDHHINITQHNTTPTTQQPNNKPQGQFHYTLTLPPGLQFTKNNNQTLTFTDADLTHNKNNTDQYGIQITAIHDTPPNAKGTLTIQQTFPQISQTPRGHTLTINQPMIQHAQLYALRHKTGGRAGNPNTYQTYTIIRPTHPTTRLIANLKPVEPREPRNLGIEKSITYTPNRTQNNPTFLADTELNGITDLTQTVVEVQIDGQPLLWDNTNHITPSTRITYKNPDPTDPQNLNKATTVEARYYNNGQATSTRPTQGPMRFYLDADGAAYIEGIFLDTDEATKRLQFVEIVSPPNVDTTNNQTVHLTFQQIGATPETAFLGNKEPDMWGYTGAPIDNTSTGLKNRISTFRFTVHKDYTITGDGIQNISFGDTGQAVLRQRMPINQVVYQLQQIDGTPVTWSSPQMHQIAKDPDGGNYMLQGTWADHTATDPVEMSPNNDGVLSVQGFLSLGQGQYRLHEIKGPARTRLDTDDIIIVTTQDEPANEYIYNKNPDNAYQYADSRHQSTQNSIDYTGVTLYKNGDYLSTRYGQNTPTTSPHIGGASFQNATYQLYYGEGWGNQTDTPVNTSDWVLDAAKSLGNLTNLYHIEPTGTVRWTGQQGHDLTININHLPWGSWYIQETQSGVGHHIDPKRYYFGDNPNSTNTNHIYLGVSSTADGQLVHDGSRNIKNTGTSVDMVRLISSELEKQTRYLNTTTPFMQPVWGAWAQNSTVTYTFGNIGDKLVRNNQPYGASKVVDVGLSRRGGNVYGLYYYDPTIDGQGVKGQPVKWADRVAEHMTITKGDPVRTDYTTLGGIQVHGATDITIATDKEAMENVYGRIQVNNLVYGSYYWKELDTQPGLILDHKEYVFGVARTADAGNGTHLNLGGNADSEAPYNVVTAETQTPATALVNLDRRVNWTWHNTFDHSRNVGSTNTLVTFGFSSLKIAETTDKYKDNGENGVVMTLTPIEGTLGDPIVTETYRQATTNSNGTIQATNGYFEFRTVPYGRWYLTSDSTEAQKKLGDGTILAEIKPLIVDFTRDDVGVYRLRFYRDTNLNMSLDASDDLLSEFGGGNNYPDQATFDAVHNATDLVDDTVFAVPNVPYYGEPYVWTRTSHLDVNPAGGAANHNFISAEMNVDWNGINLKDAIIKKGNIKLSTRVDTSNVKGSKPDVALGDRVILANQGVVTIVDHVTVTQEEDYNLNPLDKFTLRTHVVDTKTGKPVTQPVCKVSTPGSKPASFTVDTPIQFDTANTDGKLFTVFQDLHRGEINDSDCATPDLSAHPVLVSHADVNDGNQTFRSVYEGRIGTTASAKNTIMGETKKDRRIGLTTQAIIVDRIDLSKANLVKDQIYTVSLSQPVTPCVEGQKYPKVLLDQLPANLTSIVETTDQAGNCVVARPYKSATVVRTSGTNVVKLDGKDVMLKDREFLGGPDHIDVMIIMDTSEGYQPNDAITMFEAITGEGVNGLIHANVNDQNQTVWTEGAAQTNLFNVTDPAKPSKLYTPGSQVTFVDHVQARGLTAGQKFTTNLILMEKAASEKEDLQDGVKDGMKPYVDANGRTVAASKTFDTGNTSNVNYQIEVTFVASDRPVNIVAYETIRMIGSDSIAIKHHEPTDPNQTVKPTVVPDFQLRTLLSVSQDKIDTDAGWGGLFFDKIPSPASGEVGVNDGQRSFAGGKTFTAGRTVRFEDAIMVKPKLPAGKYLARLDLMTKAASEAEDLQDGVKDGMKPYVDAAGKPVVVEQHLDVAKPIDTYYVGVEFTSKVGDGKIVAYETLTRVADGKTWVHKDANDGGQTVTAKQVVKPSSTERPQTSSRPGGSGGREPDRFTPSLAKTGVASGLLVLAVGVGVTLLGAVGLRRRLVRKLDTTNIDGTNIDVNVDDIGAKPDSANNTDTNRDSISNTSGPDNPDSSDNHRNHDEPGSNETIN